PHPPRHPNPQSLASCIVSRKLPQPRPPGDVAGASSLAVFLSTPTLPRRPPNSRPLLIAIAPLCLCSLPRD
ncbi:hypothetical protein COCVIDRAFT_112566, partial [Bipolaris victoriae FI3]